MIHSKSITTPTRNKPFLSPLPFLFNGLKVSPSHASSAFTENFSPTTLNLFVNDGHSELNGYLHFNGGNEDPRDDSFWEDNCCACGTGGDIICCHKCPKVFHPVCAGLSFAPTGDYICSECEPNRQACRGPVVAANNTEKGIIDFKNSVSESIDLQLFQAMHYQLPVLYKLKNSLEFSDKPVIVTKMEKGSFVFARVKNKKNTWSYDIDAVSELILAT